jgi:hypothetical protein
MKYATGICFMLFALVARKFLKFSLASISFLALSLIVGLGTPSGARADEPYARSRLKAMSDYMAAQKTVSFDFDATLEVVTTDNQRLALASSGTIRMKRPDKIRITRAMGFANMDILFDGKTFTVLDKNANLYAQADVPGTIDHVIGELRSKYNRPFPGADLIESNVYDVLMTDVDNIKDLGAGVIGGVECDHFAFRAKEVDWEIWIADGKRPYPCQFVITSKLVTGSPQYSYRLRDWKTGDKASADDFRFRNPKNAKKADLKDLLDTMDELPKNFVRGGTK